MGICRREFGAALVAGLAASRLRAFPSRPKLIVLVIVEQFRPDYLDSISRQLAPAGFRRLLEKGAYFPDCRHLASSFPASAVATLATGAWPAQHGIVADTWLDPATRKPVAASDELLLGSTLAAQILGEIRSSRVYVVGMQESHANLVAGGADARIYWMDDNGQFATSGDTTDWLTAFNSQHPPDSFRNAKWTALSAPNGPALRTLTWSPERPGEFMTLYKSSPHGQETLFDFVGRLIQADRMGQGNTLDFLCVLAGSSELLGYDQGSRSPLMQQLMLQLDRRIEALLGQLLKVPGEGAFSLVVAGGHGAPPEPVADFRERAAVKGDSVAEAVNRALTAVNLGRVDKYIYPFLYLNTSGFRDPEPIRLVAARAALEHPAVAEYFTAGGACSTHNEWERRFRNSFHATRSGDVMLSYQAEYVEEYASGRGISYGSLYNYDVRVPLLFYGPQFRPGVYEDPVESVDVASTLARVIGVGAPSNSVGKVLGGALVE